MVTPGICAIKVNSCSSTLTPGAGSPYTGVPDETGCSTANFTAVGNNATYDYSATPYYYNSTATNSGGYSNYQAVPFESDYRTSDSTTFADPNSPWGPSTTWNLETRQRDLVLPMRLARLPRGHGGTSSTVWRTQVAPGPTTQTPSCRRRTRSTRPRRARSARDAPTSATRSSC